MAFPDLGTRVLSASAVVAYVAVGAAVILGRSVAEAARDALAWVLGRDGKAQGEARSKSGDGRSRIPAQEDPLAQPAGPDYERLREGADGEAEQVEEGT